MTQLEPTTYTTTQQQILDAALYLLAKNGYKAATTREIAKRANVNESTVFKNFENKAILFQAIKAQQSYQITEKLETVWQTIFPDVQTLIETSTQHIFTVFTQHHEYITALLRELDNEELDIGKDSIFEYTTNSLTKLLAAQTKKSEQQFVAAMFMFTSTLICMIVNQTNNFVLTDDLQTPIEMQQISSLTYQMITPLIN